MIKSEERDNPDSCWNKANEGEIVFVLLERDPSMSGTIRDWAWRRIKMGIDTADSPKIISALKLADFLDKKV